MPTPALTSSDARHTPGERTLSVRVPADQYDRLVDLAWQRRMTASALVREALRDALPLHADPSEAA